MPDRIMVVDDSPDAREIISKKLEHSGYEVLAADCAEDALGRISAFDPALVITDVQMPGMGGLGLIERVNDSMSQVDFIVITGHEDMDSTVGAMKLGAFEYLVKPIDLKVLESVVEQCLRDREASRLFDEEGASEGGGGGRVEGAGDVVGSDPRMIDVYKMIGVLSRNRATVLLRGETGTGKEMIARAIHRHSACSAEPFIAVNCAALSDSLLSSELFGHVKGAFTGANATRRGYFQLAGAGTIFLDEIGDTSSEFQTKLLRVLQERTFYPVGGEVPLTTEARVITATHRPIEALVREGYFRSDLYFRLKVIEILLPPLRERRADIPVLAKHLLVRIREKIGEDVWNISPAAMGRLVDYGWPGNVRELENVLTRAAILARGTTIRVEHILLGTGVAADDEFLPEGEASGRPSRLEGLAPGGIGGSESLDALVFDYVSRVLEEHGHDREKSAQALGISQIRLSWILRNGPLAGV